MLIVRRVKLLLQTQRGNSRLSPQQFYSGPLQCFQRIYREEGLVAFWRGNTANVARYFPSQALNFALKDKFKYIFAAPPHEVKSVPWRYFGVALCFSFGLSVCGI